MDIGIKLQNARIDAELTQEQVAEHLGVSRQTVSNWETGRTYPDIRSVVKMSDLYSVSIDHLLKEDTPMSDYLDYLEESTDVTGSKTKLSKTIIMLAYLVIWSLSMVLFWCFTDGAGAMGFSLLVMFLLLPVTAFTFSVIIGIYDYWGRGKWLVSVFFGIMYVLAEYATFTLANMLTVRQLRMPDLSLLPFGMAFSLAGLLLGSIVHFFNKRRKRNHP